MHLQQRTVREAKCAPNPLFEKNVLSTPSYIVHNSERGVLGKGSYATVFAAQHRMLQHVFAAKTVCLHNEYFAKTFARERAVFERLGEDFKHPNIIHCYESYIQNNCGVFILERLHCKTLDAYVTEEAMTERDVVHALRQIISAMLALCAKGVVVHDLKTENIAYDPVTRQCTLFDFGLSLLVKQEDIGKKVNDPTGSPLFMAPEVLRQEAYEPFLADVWSLGQLVFVMVTGYSMFWQCTKKEHLKRTVLGECFRHGVGPYIVEVPELSAELATLVRGLCRYQPGQRWSLKQADDWLAHWEKMHGC